jgi:hypothetical protein
VLSYNETKDRQIKLRHIFFPSAYGLISEIIIAVLALVAFNLSELSNQLLSKNFGNTDPLPLWSQLLRKALDSTQNHYVLQQVLLFALWAMVGALVYVLIFRTLQLFFGVKNSVGTGLRFYRQDHARGIFRWLASLHDLFMAMLILSLGGAALAIGSLICFGIASQELRDGLAGTFPANAWPLLISLLAAVLSVRLIALGISLMSRRFRNWYTA